MDQKHADYFALFYANKSSSLLGTVLDCFANLVPLWVAVLVGLVVGWIWKPRWVSILFLGIRSRPRLVFTSPPGLGGRRFWLALTASVTAFQMLKEFWLKFKAWRWPETGAQQPHQASNISTSADQRSYSDGADFARSAVGDEDLKELYYKFHQKDGGPPWELLMERSVPGMIYQAWRRDPKEGPTEYRSRTVFEGATPEIVKDFYWDDDFRPEWDDMIMYTKSLEWCSKTGAEIVHWIRKFPFFCSNREYVLGRRIYELGGIYFCITKAVPYSAVPLQKKLRRVDIYSSSWCVQAVQSPQTGQMTACEVTFLHSEDMGIQRDVAKFGVKQGMWNCVKKMEPGLRRYQELRKTSATLSHTVTMAQLVTHVAPSFFEDFSISASESDDVISQNSGKQQGRRPWKWVAVGGAVVLACALDRGVVGKVIIFGLARRLSRKV